jgi:hypothetical protein
VGPSRRGLRALPFQLSDLAAEIADGGLENQQSADAGQRQALASEADDFLHLVNLLSGVAALPPGRPGRLNDLLSVETPEQGGLHSEHVGNLPDGV